MLLGTQDLENQEERKGVIRMLIQEYSTLFEVSEISWNFQINEVYIQPGEEQFNLSHIRKITSDTVPRKTIRMTGSPINHSSTPSGPVTKKGKFLKNFLEIFQEFSLIKTNFNKQVV